MLIEDDADAVARLGGSDEIPMDHFGSVKSRHASEDALRIAFAEAMIGNFDWCLKYAPDDIYRCDDTKPLWNVLAFSRGDGVGLLMKDFDLAGIVVGHHKWFDKVYNPAFVDSKSSIEIEALSQVERTRSLFPRTALDAERQRLIALKPQVATALDRSTADARGTDLARRYVAAFYGALADDAAFYRPVVARSDVRVYKDAARTAEACGTKDVMRAGTPVRALRQANGMSEVIVLDVMWRWSEPNACTPIQTRPVWIATDAITTDYPPASGQK